jgi:adenylate kinase
VERPEHSSAFSVFASAKAKLVLLGPGNPLTADFLHQARSFSIEHVSPATLVQQEISRRTPLGQKAAAALDRPGSGLGDDLTLALVRKWFWARKPDAGYLLTGFPATLLQAKVFDEWVEARGETLTAVFDCVSANADVVTHYRTQGLLHGAARAATRQAPSLSNA